MDKFANNVKGFWMLAFIIISFGICLVPDNNYKNMKRINFISMVAAAIAMGWGILCLGVESQFVYYGF